MKLEDYITNNREQLDILSPKNGHFCRFENRLNKEKNNRKHKKIILRICWATAVAAVMLPFFVLMPWESPVPSIKEPNDNLIEVASYYKQQLNEEIKKIEKILPHLDKNARNEILSDLKQTQENLQTLVDLPDNLSEEEKISIVAVSYDNTIKSIQNTNKILAEININN